MVSVVLTDMVARTSKPRAGTQYTIWDRSLPGFGLRVGADAKTWTVVVGKERRRVTIGRYPLVGLQVARIEAKRIMLAGALARSQPDITVVPFSVALEKFIEVRLPQNRPSTVKERKRVLRKHFEPVWKNRLLTEIKKSDINRILDGLIHTPEMANHAFAVIRLFLRWAVRRGYLASSPCDGLQPPAKSVTRERVLTREELRRVLAAADALGSFGTIVLLLVLTAQRRGEVASLHSAWINREKMTITLPKRVTKNGREHTLPLTQLALQLLPQGDGLLFPARGHTDRAFNGWSNSMSSLRTASGVEDFTLHDLRRTAATMMAELRIPPHIVERILNHVTGSTAHSITTLGRIYNRHMYLDEMRDALCRWESHVLTLLPTSFGVGGVAPLDALHEPLEHFALDPTHTTGPQLNTPREPAGLLQPVDVSRRIEDQLSEVLLGEDTDTHGDRYIRMKGRSRNIV